MYMDMTSVGNLMRLFRLIKNISLYIESTILNPVIELTFISN